jgi:ABC-type multidrug transport system permease subunit
MFNLRRFFAVLRARNLEFWRDRAALGWNLAFPFLLVAGFAFVFSGDAKPEFKVGLLASTTTNSQQTAVTTATQSSFLQTRFIEFVPYASKSEAERKLTHHQIDLLVDLAAKQYWLNPDSAKGYLAERLLLAAEPGMQGNQVSGQAIRYVDFVLPGILGMNMMFSCLFGVGYVLVRYRKNAVLKRLQATPLTALEFVSAQVLSRLLIVLAISGSVFIACWWLFDLLVLGSFWLLLLVAVLGALALISLALLIASRLHSEELTGGLLNLTSWPMMILSGVWFSLEGAPVAVQQIAQLFPLTHLVSAARAVMLDGAGAAQIQHDLLALAGMSVLFLTLAAVLFRWQSPDR